MSAQSQDSVPPAPAWIERMALFRSNWPVRNDAISSLSSSSRHGRDRLLELAFVGFPLGGVGGLDELDHHARVVDLPLEGDHGQDGPLQRVQLGDVLLGALVVVPERGRAHLGLHGLYLAPLLVDVKETSTGGRRAS